MSPRKRQALLAAVLLAASLGSLLSVLLSHPPRQPRDILPTGPLRLSIDHASASGVAVTQRAHSPQLTVLKGGTASIPVLVSSEGDRPVDLTLSATIGPVGAPLVPIAPPGVAAQFAPALLRLPPAGNETAVLTLQVAPDAPTGAYYYQVTGSAGGGVTAAPPIWLVIGPYTSSRGFSLVSPEDYVARDRLKQQTEAQVGQLDGGHFLARSEGRALRVQLAIRNSNLPEQVELGLDPSDFALEAGAQAEVAVGVVPPLATPLGAYDFDVVATAGSEEHVVHFDIVLTAHPPPGTPWVLIHQDVGGYHFDLSDRYGGTISAGLETGFTYAITATDSALPSQTYANLRFTVEGTSVLEVSSMRSDVPQELVVVLDRVGEYTIHMTGFTYDGNGKFEPIGSASTAFRVERVMAPLLPPQAYRALLTLLLATGLALPASELCMRVQPSRRWGLLAVFTGAGLLLAVPLLETYSYPVQTITVQDSITHYVLDYVYPFHPFTPLLLGYGALSLALGFWSSRGLLRQQARGIGFALAVGGMLATLSVANGGPVLAPSYEAFEYGFPQPWLFYVGATVRPVDGWFVSPVIVYDVLFWTGVAYGLGLLWTRRIGRLVPFRSDTRRLSRATQSNAVPRSPSG